MSVLCVCVWCLFVFFVRAFMHADMRVLAGMLPAHSGLTALCRDVECRSRHRGPSCWNLRPGSWMARLPDLGARDCTGSRQRFRLEILRVDCTSVSVVDGAIWSRAWERGVG